MLVFPGPVHDIEEHFRERLVGLSDDYRGVVLVAGPQERTARIGAFDVTMLAEGRGLKLGEFRRFLAAAHAAIRTAQEPFTAIVSYDPLKTGLLGWRIGRRLGIPLIVEVNGDYTARSNYSEVPTALLRALKRRAYITLERFVLSHASGIKLLYPGQIDAFRSATRNAVVRVFPNLVDVRDFRDLGEAPEVLFAGFPYHLKGVDVLIAAFQEVSKEFPEWRLKILGWFPEQREMQAAIAGHARIAVHPAVYRREMPEHVGRCGIFVLPSRTEAMGRVLIEAAACAKPRIGSAVGGVPGVITHEVDGLLVAPGNVTELAQALRRLMSDRALRQRLGDNALRRVREEFSARAYFTRMREFYGAVIAAYGRAA